jgi:hypothetical protein
MSPVIKNQEQYQAYLDGLKVGDKFALVDRPLGDPSEARCESFGTIREITKSRRFHVDATELSSGWGVPRRTSRAMEFSRDGRRYGKQGGYYWFQMAPVLPEYLASYDESENARRQVLSRNASVRRLSDVIWKDQSDDVLVAVIAVLDAGKVRR